MLYQVEHIAELLKYPDNRDTNFNSERIEEVIQNETSKAVKEKNDELLKTLYCLSKALKAQDLYLKAFGELKNHDFYKAWCTLAECESILRNFEFNYKILWQDFKLNLIQTFVEKWQDLFPYNLFTSPEFVFESKCSICGRKITPRSHCDHKEGEFYDGEMCSQQMTNMSLVGVALVKDPVFKSNVVFPTDPKTGKQTDNPDYSIVKFATKYLQSPFHGWNIKWKKVRHPHSMFNNIGRNQMCPCGSEKKYKKCCLGNAKGVLLPQAHFDFDESPQEGLLMDEYQNLV